MDARMPEEFFRELEPLLPPKKAMDVSGGRPPIDHGVVVRVLWFVLCTGCRWQDVPLEMGCSGRTAHRRLRVWEQLGIWRGLHLKLLTLLRKTGKFNPKVLIVDSFIVRAFGGGEGTGPSPVDRRKLGSKQTVMVDAEGVPAAIHTSGANSSDQRELLPIVVALPKVGGKPGRPWEHPAELYADRGYDCEPTRGLLRWLGVRPFIAKRRTAHGSGLGKVRWVVERTISWIKGLRRMRIRYDRLQVIRDAWSTLAAAVICFRIAHHE